MAECPTKSDHLKNIIPHSIVLIKAICGLLVTANADVRTQSTQKNHEQILIVAISEVNEACLPCKEYEIVERKATCKNPGPDLSALATLADRQGKSACACGIYLATPRDFPSCSVPPVDAST